MPALVLNLILAFADRVEVYPASRTEIVCSADARGRRVEAPQTFIVRAVRLRLGPERK